jgi:3-dehydroquinate dehydratase-2
MAKNILLINGPNLNLLGIREPHIYGHSTLDDVETTAKNLASTLGVSLATFQSNTEGAIIDRIHAAREEKVDAIIINPGAFTHTSVGLRDALVGVSIAFIEIHITNVFARDAFRHRSYLSDKAVVVMCGMGVWGYEAALMHAAKNMTPEAK